MTTATMPRALAALLARNVPAAIDGPTEPPGWCEKCAQAPCLCPTCHGHGFVRAEDPTAYPLGVVERECPACGIAAGRRLAALQKLSVLRDFEAQTFASFEPRKELTEALVRAQAFAADPQGFIVFHGEPGTGKTHLAAAIANALKARGELVAVHVMPELLESLRGLIAVSQTDKTQNTASHDLLRSLQTVPILVLDDLGAEYGTRWAIEQTYQIVEARYRKRLPMVVTTNCLHALEERVRDRLSDDALSVVVAIGQGTASYRQMPVRLRRGAA